MNYLPYFISFLIGYLWIGVLFKKNHNLDIWTHVFLASGLGVGISTHIVFYQLIFSDILDKTAIFVVHAIVALILIITVIKSNKQDTSLLYKGIDFFEIWPIGTLLLAFIPVWFYSQLYPNGGWDAWSVWNFKARFILDGQDYWKNLFLPSLWRSSPHYPLLLPLTNVWGWLFVKNPNHEIPLLTAIFFTFLTTGLLFAVLKRMTNKVVMIFAALLLLSMDLFVKFSISQYCDILIAYYLLATFFCLVSSQIEKNSMFAFLAGIFLGFLAFTKSEATLAAVLIAFLSVPYFLWADKSQKQMNKKNLMLFLGGACITFLPTILFEIFYSPGNQTFVNGLITADNPSTLYRLKITGAFFAFQFKSPKWAGIWLLIGVGLFLSKGQCFKRVIRIIPSFLISYLVIICFYYYLNTYFRIQWWLSVTMDRILYTLIPTIIFWVFYSVWQDKKLVKREK